MIQRIPPRFRAELSSGQFMAIITQRVVGRERERWKGEREREMEKRSRERNGEDGSLFEDKYLSNSFRIV